ncbi:hypothetical protein [Salinimicrobium sp. WS361]|uniref:hypothetical protein n=1 Tax=Salinimicrobium sp. WS361 TaxID=3425123 RepID=UPI003D6F53F6
MEKGQEEVPKMAFLEGNTAEELQVASCGFTLLHVAGYMFCPATGFCCHFEGAFLRLRNLFWNGKNCGLPKGLNEVSKMVF